MARSLDEEIKWLLWMERKGQLTRHETIIRLGDLAVSRRFFEYLDLLPQDILDALRERALHASAHPEDILIVQSCNFRAGFDYEAFERRQREICYLASRSLREYFYPEQPHPRFEPVRYVGVVSEAELTDGVVVVFGEFESWLIRDHPVECHGPGGCRLVTRVVRQGHLRPDPSSPDPIVRRFGVWGLYLAENVRSPLEVPPGTELWVDRSAASDISPPLEG